MMHSREVQFLTVLHLLKITFCFNKEKNPQRNKHICLDTGNNITITFLIVSGKIIVYRKRTLTLHKTSITYVAMPLWNLVEKPILNGTFQNAIIGS